MADRDAQVHHGVELALTSKSIIMFLYLVPAMSRAQTRL